MAPDLSTDRLAFADQRMEEFATAIASLYAALYDETPADVRSFAEDGALICRIQGGLTSGDLMMLQYGHAEELAAYRAGFFRAVADQLEMAVTAYTGHDVLAQEASFDPATVSTTLRFELSPRVQEEADQREALRNWSRQVRRSSQRLKALHVEARERQRVLTARLHEQLNRND